VISFTTALPLKTDKPIEVRGTLSMFADIDFLSKKQNARDGGEPVRITEWNMD